MADEDDDDIGDEEDTLPFQPHSATSRRAAQAARPRAPGARRRVYDFIRANPGATDEEVAIGLRMSENTERPRRGELLTLKLVERRGTKPTRAGNDADAWFVTDVPYPEKWPARKAVNGEPSLAQGLEEIRQIVGPKKVSSSIQMVFDLIQGHLDEDQIDEDMTDLLSMV